MSQAFASLAVVVPTKNRPDDLEVTIAGVLDQTVLPKQLIVIDQSVDGASKRRVTARVEALGYVGLWLPMDFRRSGFLATRIDSQ